MHGEGKKVGQHRCIADLLLEKCPTLPVYGANDHSTKVYSIGSTVNSR